MCFLHLSKSIYPGIVAWAISIEVASTNSIHSSTTHNHKDFHHKNQQHQQKTPQSLVFHQFKRHQVPSESPLASENSLLLGPKGVELSDTRGVKPVAAAVISSLAKLRNIATDNTKQSSSGAKETPSNRDETNRSQSSANRIQSVANTISQNKNQKRSDNGWSENKSESVNSDSRNTDSNAAEDEDDDVERDDDNNRSNSNNKSATNSQSELTKVS